MTSFVHQAEGDAVGRIKIQPETQVKLCRNTRLAIISDSHMLPESWLREAGDRIAECRVDKLICLGDSAMDAEALRDMLRIPLMAVAGNCFDRFDLASEATLTVEGVKLLITHGHRFGVKGSLLRLRLRAEELGARVALYGHTHIQSALNDAGILMLNPGALRDGKFAVLQIGDTIEYEFY